MWGDEFEVRKATTDLYLMYYSTTSTIRSTSSAVERTSFIRWREGVEAGSVLVSFGGLISRRLPSSTRLIMTASSYVSAVSVGCRPLHCSCCVRPASNRIRRSASHDCSDRVFRVLWRAGRRSHGGVLFFVIALVLASIIGPILP